MGLDPGGGGSMGAREASQDVVVSLSAASEGEASAPASLARHPSRPISHYERWAKEEDEDEGGLDGKAGGGPPLASSQPGTEAEDAAHEHGRKEKGALLISPWARINLALTAGAFVYAVVSTFFQTPIRYYVIQDLHLNAAASNVCATIMMLPQVFQLPFGLLTDTVPIRRRRRRPYLVIGWGMVVLSMATLAVLGRPNFATLMTLILLSALGGQLVSVTAKATIVQRSEHETEAQKGQLVVTFGLCSSVGSMVGTVLGTFLYRDQFHADELNGAKGEHGVSLSLAQIGLFNAALALVVMAPCLYWMHDPKLVMMVGSVKEQEEEEKDDVVACRGKEEEGEGSEEAAGAAVAVTVAAEDGGDSPARRRRRRRRRAATAAAGHWQRRPLREELGDVWETVQRTSLLWPMLFVGVYQSVWLPNSAWDLFLIKGLGFSEWKLGLLTLIGTVLGAVGAAVYRLCLMKVNWRHIFVGTMFIMVLMDCLQLLLVFRVNQRWGVSDLLFSLGDNAVDSMVEGLHEMPIAIMYLTFCPRGAEGTTLAVLQTFTSLAVIMSNNISLLLLRTWDVSAATIASGDFNGVWKLTLLTSFIQGMGVLGVWLLPTSVHDQKERQRADRRSRWGGIAFVSFVVAAFVWTVAADVYYLYTGSE